MKQVSVIGYPRIGPNRELKKWTESYFKQKLSREALVKNARNLRERQWLTMLGNGVDFIPSNDFSFYDTFLDTAFLLNAVPERYRKLELDSLDTYFAMAKGYQGKKGDVHALPMEKWLNTNYHYIVPEIDDHTEFKLNGTKPFDEYQEALNAGVPTKPVFIGPFTFLKLSDLQCEKRSKSEIAEAVVNVYSQILKRFDSLQAALIQLDEPALVMDMSPADTALFRTVYEKLLQGKGNLKILLQTYFGDVRDSYESIIKLDFDAIGLDFVEGPENLSLIEKSGFPDGKLLFAGIVNGKNIWINHFRQTLLLIRKLEKLIDPRSIVLSTSCSLLHVPYTVKSESRLEEKYRVHFAFAEEKLVELFQLAELLDSTAYEQDEKYIENTKIIRQKTDAAFIHENIRKRIAELNEAAFTRNPPFGERREIQKKALNLPLLPTTTIGSFPQTAEIRKLRRQFKNGEIGVAEYTGAIRKRMAEVIALQERIGLDVLVHGEYERNDMVEFFGEKLAGFVFTENAWVQSYGTRCVKPPIIFGDIKRFKPMTVDTIRYAQSLTDKPVKGMLTGPVTILNWSFPREDLPRKEIALQIALAIRDEVRDLESAGIRIIQIDEAALREKLPLRKCDWHTKYLDWAIPAFRLVHSGAKPETQIHTHMCYSEFGNIITEIDQMDADVITFEAAKSDSSIIDTLNACRFKTEVGPGVYDIHSPRVPTVEEIETLIRRMAEKLDVKNLWINPDCGLKTRGLEETVPSLQNMVEAVRRVRSQL